MIRKVKRNRVALTEGIGLLLDTYRLYKQFGKIFFRFLQIMAFHLIISPQVKGLRYRPAPLTYRSSQARSVGK